MTNSSSRPNILGLNQDDMHKVQVALASFHRIHKVSDIILLGEDGACTRIILGEDR